MTNCFLVLTCPLSSRGTNQRQSVHVGVVKRSTYLGGIKSRIGGIQRVARAQPTGTAIREEQVCLSSDAIWANELFLLPGV